jgi:uncharacterized protein YjiS (DUF1127 family)
METLPLYTALDGRTRVAAPSPHRRASDPSQTLLGRAAALLRGWRRRARSRMDLAALDDRMLRDIGITRVDVWREINKPFWRP